MSNSVLEEIVGLKHAFETGIYFNEFLSKKRLLKYRIDYEVEARLHDATCLLVRDKITRDEYNKFKNKLDNTKVAYCKLLNQC